MHSPPEQTNNHSHLFTIVPSHQRGHFAAKTCRMSCPKIHAVPVLSVVAAEVVAGGGPVDVEDKRDWLQVVPPYPIGRHGGDDHWLRHGQWIQNHPIGLPHRLLQRPPDLSWEERTCACLAVPVLARGHQKYRLASPLSVARVQLLPDEACDVAELVLEMELPRADVESLRRHQNLHHRRYQRE